MIGLDEHLYEQEYILTNRFLRNLKRRKQVIEAKELDDKSFAQLKFLTECIGTIEALKNNTDTLRAIYFKELVKFTDRELEMNRLKLNNNFLLKLCAKVIPRPKKD